MTAAWMASGSTSAHADGEAQGDEGGDGEQHGGDDVRAGKAGEAQDAGDHVQQGVAPEAAQALFQLPDGGRRRGGQQAGQGQQAQGADDRARRRSLRSASGSAWATRVTPNTSISRATPRPARPIDCMTMSAIAAPMPPRALRGRLAGGGVQAGIGGVVGGDGQQQAAPMTVIIPPRNRAVQGWTQP
jgi:hypothetical protein